MNLVNVGAAPRDPSSDTIRNGFIKVNRKFGEWVSVLDFPELISGDNITLALQAAIDYACYGEVSGSKRRKVKIPGGRWRITAPIHVGYGTSFTSVVIEGDGMAYRGEAIFCGTTIIVDFDNGPAINFQGARASVLRGVSFVGRNGQWIADNQLGALAGALIDDTVAWAWVDPDLPASASSRYAPYAAITIDAYAGVRPGVSYPDVTYPGFLGAQSQYGKSTSSNVLLEDVFISGFVVGVAIQPGDSDSNGDFTKFRRVQIERVQYGVSVGNSQSRNVRMDGIEMSQYFCALTNRRHGRQVGCFGGAVADLSVGQGINIVDVNTSYGPITFQNLYFEAQWRIGDVVSTSSNDQSIIFDNVQGKFTAQNDVRGVPATVIGSAQQPCRIEFRGGGFNGFPSVMVFSHPDTRLDGVSLTPASRDASPLASTYLAHAHNALSGGAVVGLFAQVLRQSVKFKPANLDTRALGAAVFAQDGYRLGSRANCIPHGVSAASAALEGVADVVRPPRVVGQVGKSSLVVCSVSGRTLTMQFSSRTDAQFQLFGPDNGDVLLDSLTNTVFFVRSRTGTTVTAEAQNNYRAGALLLDAWSPSSGTLYWINSRVYTPPYYLRGDLTSGSASITTCARDDGFAAWFDEQIAVGDRVFVSETTDRFIHPNDTAVTARDQSAGTITLVGNAARSQTRRRFDLFVRPAPENEP
jgi:hypothetical protein